MISSTKYLTYDAAYYLTRKVKELVDDIDVDLDSIDLTGYITEEELASALDGLKGEKGDPGKDGVDGISIRNIFIDNDVLYITLTDGATYNLGNIKGQDGTVAFEQLTDEQIAMLKGEEGKAGATFIPSVSSNGDLSWINTGGYANPVTVNIKGDKGDAFKYEDFTEEQLAALKGADGTMSFEDLTPAQKESLKGDPGEPGAPGEKGEPGDPGVHYGTEAPTDGTLIWVNPDGEACPDYLTRDEVDTVITDKVNEKIKNVNPADINVDLSGCAGIDHKHTKADITDLPTLGSAARAEVGTTVTSGSDLLPTSNAVYVSVNNLRTELLNKIPSLEGYATETYVANAIAGGVEIEMEGYATEEYVNNAIENIETGNVDLSNYYNKEEVNALIPKAVDLSSYYNKTQTESVIDAKIAQITHLTETEVNALIDTKIANLDMTGSLPASEGGAF
jgi:hypothetical protein